MILMETKMRLSCPLEVRPAPSPTDGGHLFIYQDQRKAHPPSRQQQDATQWKRTCPATLPKMSGNLQYLQPGERRQPGGQMTRCTPQQHQKGQPARRNPPTWTLHPQPKILMRCVDSSRP